MGHVQSKRALPPCLLLHRTSSSACHSIYINLRWDRLRIINTPPNVDGVATREGEKSSVPHKGQPFEQYSAGDTHLYERREDPKQRISFDRAVLTPWQKTLHVPIIMTPTRHYWHINSPASYIVVFHLGYCSVGCSSCWKCFFLLGRCLSL